MCSTPVHTAQHLTNLLLFLEWTIGLSPPSFCAQLHDLHVRKLCLAVVSCSSMVCQSYLFCKYSISTRAAKQDRHQQSVFQMRMAKDDTGAEQKGVAIRASSTCAVLWKKAPRRARHLDTPPSPPTHTPPPPVVFRSNWLLVPSGEQQEDTSGWQWLIAQMATRAQPDVAATTPPLPPHPFPPLSFPSPSLLPSPPPPLPPTPPTHTTHTPHTPPGAILSELTLLC